MRRTCRIKIGGHSNSANLGGRYEGLFQSRNLRNEANKYCVFSEWLEWGWQELARRSSYRGLQRTSWSVGHNGHWIS